VYEHLDRKIS
jgi:hypothetical protein